MFKNSVHLHMFTKKSTRTIGLLTSIIALFTLELFWLHNVYHREYKQVLADINDAFNAASQKEQTYRISVNEIVRPGDVTIQSCGEEEIRIIRQCPLPDTIIFDNTSEQSLETFIHYAFYKLRESITPLNIYCLSDLFAGALQEKNIFLLFSIEYFNTATGEIIETTAEKWHPAIRPTCSIIRSASAKTSLRANMQFSKTAVFKRMSGDIIISACLLLIIVSGLIIILYSSPKRKQNTENKIPPVNGKLFEIGQYHFDSEKNELCGFDKTVHLNKKENSLLRTLCEEQGKVVEREFLLKNYWGSAGLIYSRSLDTYITKLRKYLKEDSSVQITTIKGQGYKLTNSE
jgi:hypothetical protein